MLLRLGGLCAAVLAFVLAIAAISASPADAETRVALVIGNGGYRHVPTLPNPPNDASDIAASLRRLGFDVRRVIDGSFDDMRRALLEFGQKARRADMAIVFYAGHGMEIGGQNWLIPVDAELKSDLDAEQEAISLRSVMTAVSAASKLGLVVLDSCRNNPFAAKMQRSLRTRSVQRGFAPVEPTGSVLVAYAAKDGTTAADGSGRNSPFSAALLRNLETPGLEINFLFRNVRDEVIKETDHEQEPFVYGSLSKEAIYLKAAPTPPPAPSPDQVMWGLIKDTSDANALKRFVRQFPKSPLHVAAEERIAALAAIPKPAPPPPPPPGPSPDEVMWNFLKDTNDANALKRFAKQFPKSPLRAAAEERIAALAAIPKPAPPPIAPKGPSAEDVAWGLLKDTKDAGELRRFLAEFPRSARRSEAETRIAALAVEEQKIKSALADPREIARSLQFELKRVGCFDGAVNGEYGRATRAALRRFAKLAALNLPEENPPIQALKAVRAVDKRICPLVCQTGERAEGGRCIRIVCPSGQVLKEGNCVAKSAKEPRRANASPAAPVAPSPASGGKCFTFEGKRFCE